MYVLAVFMHMGGAAAKCVLWARSRELGTAHLGWRVDQEHRNSCQHCGSSGLASRSRGSVYAPSPTVTPAEKAESWSSSLTSWSVEGIWNGTRATIVMPGLTCVI